MMNLRKKMVMVCLVLSLCLTAAANVFAVDNSKVPVESTYATQFVDFDLNPNDDPIGKVVKYKKSSNVKLQIVKNAEKYKKTKKSLSDAESKTRTEEIDAFFAKIATLPDAERYTPEFFSFLKEHDLVFYELGKPENSAIGTMSTSVNDVSVNTPFGAYDSVNGWWEIWGGFNYTNDNGWWSERPTCWYGCDPIGNIGGYDTLGINLSGGTAGAALKDFNMQAIWHDAPSPYNSGKTGQFSYKVTNRVGTLDSSVGAMFLGQDTISSFGLGTDGYQKFANNFGAGSVVLKYDSKFANANGLARVYYRHTWNSTTIDSVTLNSDGTFSITIKNGENATPTIIGRDYSY